MSDETGKLPYAIMCALREIAGLSPSTSFRPIGTRRPSPEAMRIRRPYTRPLTPVQMSEAAPTPPESRYEYSASTQDLVDFGLIEHGYWYDGRSTQYGFHLTEKAVDILRADNSGPLARHREIN